MNEHQDSINNSLYHTDSHVLLENIPAGVIVTDKSGIVQYMNAASEKIFHRKRDTLLGQMLGLPVEFGKKTEVDIFRLNEKPGFALMEVSEIEWETHKANLIFFHDITERREAEDEIEKLNRDLERKVLERTKLLENEIAEHVRTVYALRDSEERYRFFFEDSGVGIGCYKPDGTIISYNNLAASHMMGKPEDFEGKSIYEVFPKREAEFYMDRIKKSIASEGLIEYEDSITLASGDKWFLSIFNQIHDVKNQISGVQIVSYDITDRKTYEIELQKAKEAAEAANMAKSQFLANMSHEIRTPMNGFMGMLQLLELTELTEEQMEYIHIAKTASDSLLAVLNDILDYSKLEAGKMELEKATFTVQNTIRDAASIFTLSAKEKGTIIEITTGSEIPNNLIGDSFRLRQILSNLIGNAVKFTNKGRIDISVRKIEELNNHEVRLEFVVKDTGIGIPNDKVDVLFKSFSQGDSSNTRKYGGTGLGLSISKGIVEKMGGEIWVESIEGEGSSFYFTCKFEKTDLETITGDSAVEKQIEGQKNINILLVEDDKISKLLFEKAVTKKGWEATIAENGSDAFEIFKQKSFNIVLMDVQMPIVDGFTATGMIRTFENTTHTHTPIVAMTAFSLKGDREKCLNAGMDDYISKPLDLDEFYSMVEKWTNKIL